MSGIAEVLLNLGYDVQGSRPEAERGHASAWRSSARASCIGHARENVGGRDVVVDLDRGRRPDNPEVVARAARRIPVIPRAEMLAELMRFKYAIAVAGTHGKTTTTSLVVVDPRRGRRRSDVRDRRPAQERRHATRGSAPGDYLVAEADESDGSFLHLQPTIAIVTNIDNEHLDARRRLREAQAELRRVPAQPAVLRPRRAVHRRRARARASCRRSNRPVVSYGLGEGADLRADEPRARRAAHALPRVRRADATPLAVTLNLPGVHNVRNALAAIAVATELEHRATRRSSARSRASRASAGASRTSAKSRPRRRRRVTLVDDYGHHPTEIEATLDAVRQG